MRSQEQTVLMPLRNFPLQDYSRNALEAFVREYTSPHWDESLVLHNHYVIFNDYDENIDDFATTLYRALKKEKPETFSGIITEEVLLSNPQRLQQKAFNRNYFLFVTDCKDSEMDDEDSAQWEAVRKITETPNAPTIFLVTTREIFEKRFRGNDALYHRFFTRETRIIFKEDFAPEEIHSLLNEEIDVQLPFQRTDEFDDRLSAYLKDVYPKADLKRQDFIEDMLRRINALYYQKGLDDELLTEACVPFWNPVVEETSSTATEQEESSDEEPPSDESPVKEISVEPAEADIPEKCKNCSKKEQAEKEAVPEIAPELIRIPRFTANNDDLESNDAENILILALSTLSRKYDETDCFDPEGNMFQYYYQLEPIPKMLYQSGTKIDKVIILASAATVKPANYTIPVDEIKRLQAEDGPEDFNCQASALDYFAYRLNQCLEGNIPEYRIFTYADSAEELESINSSLLSKLNTSTSIIETLYGILAEIRKTKNTNLYVDIHGGLRLQQQILSGVLSLLDIEGIHVDAQHVYSVEYNGSTKPSKIVGASESIKINKFVSGMNELSKYARIGSLKEYIQDNHITEVSNLLDILESISTDIQFCNVARFEEDLKKLPHCLEIIEHLDSKNSMISLFPEDVRETFGNLATETPTPLDELKWCVEKGFYQQALSIIEARMPDYFVEENIIQYSEATRNELDRRADSRQNDVPGNPFIATQIGRAIDVTYGYHWTNRKILDNPDLDIYTEIINQKNAREWSYERMVYHFKNKPTLRLMLLHYSFKKLRNAMNHPTSSQGDRTLPEFDSVKERLQEYIYLSESLSQDNSNWVSIDYDENIEPLMKQPNPNKKSREVPKFRKFFKR